MFFFLSGVVVIAVSALIKPSLPLPPSSSLPLLPSPSLNRNNPRQLGS